MGGKLWGGEEGVDVMVEREERVVCQKLQETGERKRERERERERERWIYSIPSPHDHLNVK